MKTVPGALQTHLEGRLTTICYCVVITREDGTILRFTSLDRDLVFDSQTYKIGYDPTAIASTDQFNVDNLEFAGAIDHDDITSEDIRAGLYDHATFEIFLCNWADTSQGKVTLKTGWLGNISISFPGGFEAEGRSLMQALQVKYGKHYTPNCKWDLGEIVQDRLAGQIGCQIDLRAEAWQASTEYMPGAVVQPTTPNGTYYQSPDGGTSGASEPAFATTGGAESDGTWSITNDIGSATVRMSVVSGAQKARLEQTTVNASVYQCDEFDLLLSTIAEASDFGLPKEMLTRAEQPYLSALTSLRLIWTQQIISATQGTRCGAPRDYAGTLIALELLNDVGQHLYYQLWTYDSRPFAWSGNWFDPSLSDDAYCGVNDDVTVHGETLLTAGGSSRSYNIDILSRLTTLIANAPVSGLNKSLAGFKIRTIYLGSVVNGEASIVADHWGINVTYNTGAGNTTYLVDPGFVNSNKLHVVSPIVASIAKNIGELGTAASFHVLQWGASGHLLDGQANDSHGLIPTLNSEGAPVEIPEIPPGPDPTPTIIWESLPPLQAFWTIGTVATVIDEFREFTATGTFITDKIIPVPVWEAKHKYFAGDSVRPSSSSDLRAVALTNGKSGKNEPTWPTTEGETVLDGSPDLDEGETQLTWRMVQDRWYQHGVLKFTGGAMANFPREFEVADYDPDTLRFRLVFATPYSIEVGDTFEVEVGCDKTLPTCIYKFHNAVNFGGEPFVQGFDSANDYPTDDI